MIFCVSSKNKSGRACKGFCNKISDSSTQIPLKTELLDTVVNQGWLVHFQAWLSTEDSKFLKNEPLRMNLYRKKNTTLKGRPKATRALGRSGAEAWRAPRGQGAGNDRKHWTGVQERGM